nr:MAG TPA: hypothetical protein [Caudoviricetes sp.]
MTLRVCFSRLVFSSAASCPSGRLLINLKKR